MSMQVHRRSRTDHVELTINVAECQYSRAYISYVGSGVLRNHPHPGNLAAVKKIIQLYGTTPLPSISEATQKQPRLPSHSSQGTQSVTRMCQTVR